MLEKSFFFYKKKNIIFNKIAFLKIPKVIVASTLIILMVSIFCLYSLCDGKFYPLAFKQLIYILISMFVFYLVISVNIKIFYKFSYLFLLITYIALISVICFGRQIMGSARWLSFGFITVQPSEFAKVVLVLVLARFFSRINVKDVIHKPFRLTLLAFLPVLPLFILVAMQPDLATSIIILSVATVIIFVFGIPKRVFITAVIGVAIGIPIVWLKFLKDYQKLRIINFLSPEHDPLGSGYNVIQSKIAIGSGGFFGKGYLNGTQGKMKFLPENHTDFIFSAFSEEFGFLCSLIMIAMYLIIIFYGFVVAAKVRSTFCKLTAIGCSTLIFFHFFINIGMTLGIMPVAGIPLIMFSYGGSHLLLGMICIGLIVNIDINRDSL